MHDSVELLGGLSDLRRSTPGVAEYDPWLSGVCLSHPGCNIRMQILSTGGDHMYQDHD